MWHFSICDVVAIFNFLESIQRPKKSNLDDRFQIDSKCENEKKCKKKISNFPML